MSCLKKSRNPPIDVQTPCFPLATYHCDGIGRELQFILLFFFENKDSIHLDDLGLLNILLIFYQATHDGALVLLLKRYNIAFFRVQKDE